MCAILAVRNCRNWRKIIGDLKKDLFMLYLITISVLVLKWKGQRCAQIWCIEPEKFVRAKLQIAAKMNYVSLERKLTQIMMVSKHFFFTGKLLLASFQLCSYHIGILTLKSLFLAHSNSDFPSLLLFVQKFSKAGGLAPHHNFILYSCMPSSGYASLAATGSGDWCEAWIQTYWIINLELSSRFYSTVYLHYKYS